MAASLLEDPLHSMNSPPLFWREGWLGGILAGNLLEDPLHSMNSPPLFWREGWLGGILAGNLLEDPLHSNNSLRQISVHVNKWTTGLLAPSSGPSTPAGLIEP
jgi:predicted nicotinamide N-methyase